MALQDFHAKDLLDTFTTTTQETMHLYRLSRLEQIFNVEMHKIPFSIRILLEAAVRACDHGEVTVSEVEQIVKWTPQTSSVQIPFKPARVVMQDHTGLPCVLDMAAMRDAIQLMGGNPDKINPVVPVDLVIDHSLQVDVCGSPDALQQNMEIEITRNYERYEFLRWGAGAFQNFRVVPPGMGIIHQINLEYLAQGVVQKREQDTILVYPDTLIGTDSHTPMINGLGIVGWGVGGIEAEAVMLGQPLYLLLPRVIGVKLCGYLQEGVTATDLALTITQLLRKKNVVDTFVEFYGTGLSQMTLPDRATIANMAPEYGATMAFFPVDSESIDYLRRTGRTQSAKLAECYYKEQGLFRTDATEPPLYSDIIEVDLESILPCVAGPKRPQDRVFLANVQQSFKNSLTAPIKERGYALTTEALSRPVVLEENDTQPPLRHGAVAIAAITSCTNTSNPSVMIAAGLLARKALRRGLTIQPYVKTSMAPGSRVVTHYLTQSGLLEDLQRLGFGIIGYGCTTCIGSSGPIFPQVAHAVTQHGLIATSVISGNRNFEGRVHSHLKANYLASPPLVIAYALAGTVDRDLTTEPLGQDRDGQPVYLHDLWPSQQEIAAILSNAISPDMFVSSYKDIWHGSDLWNRIPVGTGNVYRWNTNSTYIQFPSFFRAVELNPRPRKNIYEARVLLKVGDSTTTDHISPAGAIAPGSPAGLYLLSLGVKVSNFNQYATRRGNHHVMIRGFFANRHLHNHLVPDIEGGITVHHPSQSRMPIFDAIERYQADDVPLVILAGKDYGMGSSRDWAAKGTLLAGVRAVIAESFERIHRSNLVGMGVLPFQYKNGDSAEKLGLTGSEVLTIIGVDAIQPKQELEVIATRQDGTTLYFPVIARLDTSVEVDYYNHGGILLKVLRDIAKRGE